MKHNLSFSLILILISSVSVSVAFLTRSLSLALDIRRASRNHASTLTLYGGLEDLTVLELKSRLKDAGLKVSGTKKDLIIRLQQESDLASPPVKTSKQAQQDETVSTDSRKSSSVLKNLLTKKTTRGSKDRSIEDEILLSSESENSIEEASVASLMKIGEKKKSTARVSSINNISIKNKNSRTSRTKSTKRIDDIDVDDFFLELMEEGDDDLPEIIDEGRNAGKKANQRSSRGSSSLTEEDIAEIQKLVNERDAARRLMDYDTADTVRGKIESEYGVKFYDHRGTWVAPDGTTGKYYTKQVVNTDNSGQGIPIVPAEQVACTMSFDEVQNLVFERTAARRARRFAEADDIRDELARNGIELHDNTNKWVSVDGKLTGYQSGDYDNYLSNISR